MNVPNSSPRNRKENVSKFMYGVDFVPRNPHLYNNYATTKSNLRRAVLFTTLRKYGLPLCRFTSIETIPNSRKAAFHDWH